MALRLPQAMIDEMVQHAKDDLPNEACGMITGDTAGARKLTRARNAESSPFRYTIHPLDQKAIEEEADENDWTVQVIYHSHVASEAYPSPTDVRLSQWQGGGQPMDLYPGAYYVLVSLKDTANPVVRAFQISGGEVTEEPIVAI